MRLWRAQRVRDALRGRQGRGCNGSIRCGTSSSFAEQERILQLLVARGVVRQNGLQISLRVEGITKRGRGAPAAREQGAAARMTELRLSPGSMFGAFVPIVCGAGAAAALGGDNSAPPPKIDRALEGSGESAAKSVMPELPLGAASVGNRPSGS